ncbi:hypothetical protein J2W32_002270 [Variovorax boronicumulans]|uniref:Uncharacterized protein n=1 Tax=Variovorax boronicumulans TaxID=436515 RepID=A0AAW8CTA5_9BURK|nr:MULTISPECIES: hypothetical protein [Variovorax]MDP9893664.1 hypothetical protein [Variovorax boronicumulans]MDP9995909.1 hypothetical protein [Variovorax boronicumulans]MDQ0007030.1 hypothetical protein [Variovorax boronicumulans]MDQ0036581.1 hypothetical protein [Variovorax boronicumulans]MDQ0053222.1 hypothetical protein [Variovorax boronicumulans]
MQRPRTKWPQARSLDMLLQSPAHRVVRVLLVTQTHWQLPEHRSRRRRA